MSPGPLYPVEPWCLREEMLDQDALGLTESLFALSNGHIGLRGTLEEGEPHHTPGSYLNSFYELRPLPYAESAYGYPESGQTMINVTNGTLVRLLVEDEPFDVRYGTLRRHERVLDFSKGTLERNVEWESPSSQAVRVKTTRLVSLTQRAIAAIRYEVSPVDEPIRVVLQSELVANEQMPPQADDPRAAAVLAQPLQSEEFSHEGTRASLVHQTKNSKLRVAVAMDHVIEGPEKLKVTSDCEPDTARVTVAAMLQPGETLTLTKFIGYGWSSKRSIPAMRDQVVGAISLAQHGGWSGLVDDQKAFLDDFWKHSDVEIDGDPELQQAIRFALFNVIQASARAERRPIPAKGLTGPGYDGHAFWDMESHILPVLNFTAPEAARDELRWRHSTLPMAKERARVLGQEGSAFPWRTINGEECSGYWPAGTAAFHINADIADAVIRHVEATGDDEFERDFGIELLVETARLWRSLGHHDIAGEFRIDGVTGPDEYSAIVDNNVFTNLMAKRNLLGAAAACERHLDQAHDSGVDAEELASWREAAQSMRIPFDEMLKIHPQSEGFTRHEKWDFERTKEDQYPLLLHFPYFELYRTQVVKQADLVLAMLFNGDEFDAEQKLRNFDYYESITVRDSSLSACAQAMMAAEVGHLDLAFDYLGEAAFVDLHNLDGNTQDGLHLASLAGTWLSVVQGLSVLRQNRGQLSFAPRLPSAITRLSFGIRWRDRCIRVEVHRHHTTYEMSEGEPLDITHHGEKFTLEPGVTARREIDDVAQPPEAQQPYGRRPVDRHQQLGPRIDH